MKGNRNRKNIFKNIICLLIMTVIIFSDKSVFADDGGYTIDEFKVTINVGEDNVLSIVEELKVNFSEAKHGIYREIPLINNIEREDGSKNKVRGTITDISCSSEYEVNKSLSKASIRLGSADSYVSGIVPYEISYKYHLNRDLLKDKDEFYFNIIGDKWETTIKNVEFYITMPKEFDEELLGFSMGRYGEMNSEEIEFVSDGKNIKGYTKRELYNKEAVTIRLELPEGYFVNSPVDYTLSYNSLIFVMILCLIITFIIWNKHGKDDMVIETVHFNAPAGLNSLEMAYALNCTANGNDAASLIIYLAGKGYIEIHEIPNTNPYNLLGTEKMKLIKLKSYDGTNEYEKEIMNSLFKNSNEVTSDNISEKFYETTVKISTMINTEENKDRLYEVSSQVAQKKVSTLASFVFLLVSVFSIGLSNNLAIQTLLLIGGVPIANQLKNPSKGRSDGKNRALGVFGWLIFLLGAALLVYSGGELLETVITIMVLEFLVRNVIMVCVPAEGKKTLKIILALIPFAVAVVALNSLMGEFIINMVIYFLGLCCWFIMCVASAVIVKRTKEGTKIRGDILGFKNFLTYAKKEELEALTKVNPSYFFDILPYAYVLQVSNEWSKKFVDIMVKPPSWYYDADGRNDIFDHHRFNRTMDSFVTAARTSSAPRRSGVGSSSGGGFSGGGSGGGGGGSW